MAITLHLAPEQEAKLRQKARLQGQEAENYALSLLLRDLAEVPLVESESESLALALEGFIGTLNSREHLGRVAHDAENAGQVFSEILVEKHKANHL